MAILPVGFAVEEGGYQIERSLRFNSADSAYLSRTFTTPTNNKKWSISMWVKRSALGANQALFSQGYDGSDYFDFRFNTSDQLYVQNRVGASNLLVANTTAVFRDVSAWYHLVFVFDSDNATAAYRNRLWMNNVEYTWSANSGSGNASSFNRSSAQPHVLGISQTLGTPGLWTALSGYMTEVHFIDGSALDPSSFGETDTDTGVWKPKAYSGSYGTNGFYLDFGDNSSTTALGYDAAGSNDWTPNNFSVTAGAGNDSLVDSPTRYGTDTGVGGEVRGNYATRNPLAAASSATGYTTNGNLDAVWSSGGSFDNAATIGFDSTDSSGYYWEYLVNGTALSRYPLVGIANSDAIVAFTGKSGGSAQPGTTSGGWMFENASGSKFNNNTTTSYGTTTTSGWGCVAVKNGKIFIGSISGGVITWKNSGNPVTESNPMFSGITGIVFPTTSEYSSGTISYNFGQQAFQATAPSGFKALCTTNLPEPTIAEGGDYFNVNLWEGTGTQTRSFTGIGFQPDLVWAKIRSGTVQDHQLYDAVRGAGGGKNLSSNTTASEGTVNTVADSDYGYVSSFDSDGFSVNDGAIATTGGYVNYSGRTYVAWNWKANGAGVLNEVGTIDSTVSANTTAGFSIVKWAGNITAGATVGHGLGVAPDMVMYFSRDGASHPVYHKSIGATGAVFTNLTNGTITSSTYFNNTAPSSTVLTLGDANSTNSNGTNGMVAYCFSAIAGYSAFGSYTGNGSSDGPFVHLGFRPRYLLTKCSSSSGTNWVVQDTTRFTYNLVDDGLLANTSAAEYSSGYDVDILSNGFKLRRSGGDTNASGGTYIYAAFASNPFKFSLGA